MNNKTISLAADLKNIEKLAFKRLDKVKTLLAEIHRLLEDRAHRKHRAWLHQLRRWLLTSYTIWPADYKGLGEYACKLIAEVQELDDQMLYIMENLQELPSKNVRAVVAEKELEVERGNYDPYLKPSAQRKFKAYEKELQNNPLFHEGLAKFDRTFPGFLKLGKVLRRRLCMERNFRVPGFEFDPTNPKHKAMLAFDLLCYRWSLFGVEDCNKPLLQKLSVNATPHGIMIVIPSYWSLDYKRDLNWKEINRLHKSWDMQRQSDSWSRAERADQQRNAYHAKLDGVADGLKGAELYAYIIEKAGLSKLTEHANVRKEVNAGKKLVEGME